MPDSPIQFELRFEPEVTPRGDGTWIVKPGKPIVGRRRLTVAQAAAQSGLSADTIRRLYDGGFLEGENPSPRRIFIFADSLEAHQRSTRDREFWDQADRRQLYLDTIHPADAADAAEPLDKS